MCVPAQSEPTEVLWIPWSAVLDDVGRHDEVGGDERRQHEHEAAREPDEEPGGDERDGERGPAHLVEVDQVVLRPPPRQQREGVRDRARGDEARVRDEERQDARDDRGRDEHAPATRDGAVDGEPEQRDQRERREVEHVPLLDPVDEARRGEGGDLGEQPDRRSRATRRRTRGRRGSGGAARARARAARRTGRCRGRGRARRRGRGRSGGRRSTV